jgi:hypothetical protein
MSEHRIADDRRNVALKRHRASLASRRLQRDSRDARPRKQSGSKSVMTTNRQRQANKSNARASTGPRSAAGKVRVGGNARRHGLSIPVLNDVGWSLQIDELARRIADGTTDPLALEQAKLVAEAQVDLMRIRAYRTRFLTRRMRNWVQESKADQKINAEFIGMIEEFGRPPKRLLQRMLRQIARTSRPATRSGVQLYLYTI